MTTKIYTLKLGAPQLRGTFFNADFVVHARLADGAPAMTLVKTKASQRWGDQVTAAGFTSVPNYLLNINRFMDKNDRLSPTELLVLLQILSYWWHPYDPDLATRSAASKSIIAEHLGVSTRQVQRALTGLEKKGLIERIRSSNGKGRISNEYDVTGLIKKVRILAAQHPAAFNREGYFPEVEDCTITLQNYAITHQDGTPTANEAEIKAIAIESEIKAMAIVLPAAPGSSESDKAKP
jgi:DNA-binding MarR family transcriptional regulator